MLTEERQELLIREYQASKSTKAANEIVLAYLPKLQRCARVFARHAKVEDVDALVNEGVFGLMDAMASFTIGRACFWTYAQHWVRLRMRAQLAFIDGKDCDRWGNQKQRVSRKKYMGLAKADHASKPDLSDHENRVHARIALKRLSQQLPERDQVVVTRLLFDLAPRGELATELGVRTRYITRLKRAAVRRALTIAG